MMARMSRTNRILGVVLALQLVLVALVFWPRPAVIGGGDDPLLAGFDPAEVAQIRLLDQAGNRIALAKTADGWGMPDADDFPVQSTRADELVQKLADLKTNRLVTEQTTSHRRLKVASDSFERLVEIEAAGGQTHQLFIGTSPTFNYIHVRLAGQNQVFLVSGLSISDVSTSVSAWIDTRFISVPQEEIVGMTLRNGHGTFEFTRITSAEGESQWQLAGLEEGETLNDVNVRSLATRAGSIYIMKPLGKTPMPAYGMESPTAMLTVERQDADGNPSSYSISVGARSEEDGSYAMLWSQSPYYVRAAEYSVRELVEWGRDDFLQQPTPTPEPAQAE